MARLGKNRYGKSAVRIVKVKRADSQHELYDAEVAIALEGDFESAHATGDNSHVLPTDTMKNTVYALAREHLNDAIEDFALALGRHFLEVHDQQGSPLTAHVTRAHVRIAQNLWERIDHSGTPHPHAFRRAGTEQRLARVVVGRSGTVVHGGIDELIVLKTANSAFAGYPRDAFTTLPETSDRIMATALRAVWRYDDQVAQYTEIWSRARAAILETFAGHASESVQHTLHAMGECVLDRCAGIDAVRFVLPNQHHIPVDLARFGLENRNDIFVATTEPFGRIEATLVRDR